MPDRPASVAAQSPFAAVFQSADREQVADVLDANVVFRSPAANKPYRGAAACLPVLAAAREALAELTYHGRVADGDREVLFFHATVEDRTVEGIDVVVYGPDGRVIELTVMIRPLSGLQTLAVAVGRLLRAAT